MRDENLIYTNLEDDKIKITPKEGYKIYYMKTQTILSEAITIEKELKYFISIK